MSGLDLQEITGSELMLGLDETLGISHGWEMLVTGAEGKTVMQKCAQ